MFLIAYNNFKNTLIFLY